MSTIVIAWVVEEVVYDGRPYARDLGASPGMRTVRSARAVVWLHGGGTADIEAAQAFVAKEGRGTVFVFPASEEDPLGVARKSILEVP